MKKTLVDSLFLAIITAAALVVPTHSQEKVNSDGPTLRGDDAIRELKKEGRYGSLMEAYKAAAKTDLEKPTTDDAIGQSAKLAPLDLGINDRFGHSVAISGSTAIIGAYQPDNGISLGAGAAYVFLRTGNAWTLQQRLTAPDGAANDFFGFSVGISGETVVVGAWGADDPLGSGDAGSAYVFVRSGTTWTFQQELIGSGSRRFFGESVAITGETAVVGSPGNLSSRGEAYVFIRSGVTWSEQAKLSASDGSSSDRFGSSIAISGETVVVGASRDGVVAPFDFRGSAYVFLRNGTSWAQQQKLIAPDGADGDLFGTSVSISGETAVVGSPRDDDQGSAYVFIRTGSSWALQQKFTNADTPGFDNFGISVAIFEDTIVAGANLDNLDIGPSTGSASVFVRTGTAWELATKLTASDARPGDQFGNSVAISGSNIIVGDSQKDIGTDNTDEGAAYVFRILSGNWTVDEFTTASDGERFDVLGTSVAVDGNVAVVGATGADINGNSGQGAAYVFARSGPDWVFYQKLVASDGTEGDGFGYSVGMSGNTVIVGAYNNEVGANNFQGSAYVFASAGGSFIQQQKLTAADGGFADQFGTSVAIENETVIVGAPNHDYPGSPNQGAAYVYVRSGSSWSLQQKLTAVFVTSTEDNFGSSVALSGETAVIGQETSTGDAYVFVRSGSNWTFQQLIITNSVALSSEFRVSVDISANTIIVGNYVDDVGTNLLRGAAYIYVRGGTTWTLQQKIFASDGDFLDNFGWSVALDADTAVVGSRYDDVGSNEDQGSAYVFVRSGSVWSEQQKLTASDGAARDHFGASVGISLGGIGQNIVAGAPNARIGSNNSQGAAYRYGLIGGAWTDEKKLIAADGSPTDNFGISVAVSGDTAVVGASQDDIDANVDQGSAYVFVRLGGGWSLQQKLTAADGALGDLFGRSVSIFGNTVVVGAPGSSSGQGAGYAFVRVGSAWSQQQKLTASDGAANDRFGVSVSVDGETVIVGANGDDASSGAAYVFTRSFSTWSEQQKLVAGDRLAGDNLGISVSLSGVTAVVGAYLDDIGANDDQGSAYVFVGSGSFWSQQAKLTASAGSADDQFGFSVGISGELVIVGVPRDDIGPDVDRGSAYVFGRSGTTWSPLVQLGASDGEPDDRFGKSVAISGDIVVIGAYLDDVFGNSNQGSAYVWEKVGTTWSERTKLTNAAGESGDQFGTSVAISGDKIVVGAPFADIAAPLAGNGSAAFAPQATDQGVIGIFVNAPFAPTAASVSLSGRILTADGRGIRNARLSISGGSLTMPLTTTTGTFGYYNFTGLRAGETYFVTVEMRKYSFKLPSRAVTLQDSISDFDFVATPEAQSLTR